MEDTAAAPAATDTPAPAPEAAPDTPSEAPQEAAPAPAEAPAEEAPKEYSIDDLLSAEMQDPIITSGESHTGINYQQVLNELPDDAKRLISNLRSSYTKKTQDIAEQKKIMQQHVEEISGQREALYKSEFYKDVQEAAAKEPGNLDPYDPKSFEARIQSEVAKRMQDMLKPMKQAHELQQQKHALDNFKREHPDMEEMKTDIAKVLIKNDHMDLEQAYWVIKGKRLQDQHKTQTEELGRYKNAARSAGLKVGGDSRGKSSGVPQYVLDKDDPVAIYKWIEANKTK